MNGAEFGLSALDSRTASRRSHAVSRPFRSLSARFLQHNRTTPIWYGNSNVSNVNGLRGDSRQRVRKTHGRAKDTEVQHQVTIVSGRGATQAIQCSGGSLAMHRHQEAVPWPKRNHRLWLHLVTRHRVQRERTCDHRHQDFHLHHGEVAADAHRGPDERGKYASRSRFTDL